MKKYRFLIAALLGVLVYLGTSTLLSRNTLQYKLEHADEEPCEDMAAGQMCEIWRDGGVSVVARLYDQVVTEGVGAIFYIVFNDGESRWHESDSNVYHIEDGDNTYDFVDLTIHITKTDNSYTITSETPLFYTLTQYDGCFDDTDGLMYMDETFINTPHSYSQAQFGYQQKLIGPGRNIWEKGQESLFLVIGAVWHDYAGMQILYFHDDLDASYPVMTEDLPEEGRIKVYRYGIDYDIYLEIGNCGRGLYPYSVRVDSNFMRPVAVP